MNELERSKNHWLMSLVRNFSHLGDLTNNSQGGLGDVHGPDKQFRLSFLIGNDMLNPEGDDELAGIGPSDISGMGLRCRFFL